MKLIVTAALALMVCGADAQGVRPALPDPDFLGLEPTRVEEVSVPAFVISSDSGTAVAALDTIPNAPLPMTAVIRSGSITNSRSKEFKTFRSDRFNRMLVATEFWTRGLDALSTYNRLNDPCGCYREGNHFLGLEMTPFLKSAAGAYSYSLGVATVNSFVSARLWDASKTRPRHAGLLRGLSRALLIGDSFMEVRADVHNFSMPKPGPSVKSIAKSR